MTTSERADHCPHCDRRLVAAMPQDGNHTRCSGCGFVYPRPAATLENTNYHDYGLLPDDRYRLVSPLRTRGGGRVYLARHLVVDEPCVVKILSTIDPEYSDAACGRFVAEAKAGFRINHPNVARVLDCDRSGDEWYFVMEYVNGANLGEIIQACRRLPWPQVAQLGVGTARGLAAIHSAGMVHRDIKPGNLILSPDGSVKITDLGLVQFLDGSGAPGRRSVGIGNGTPKYMSPEQRDGRGALDARSDIYSVGATLYHLLVGRPPRRGGDDGPLAYLAGEDSHAPLDWPAEIAPAIPKGVRSVVEKCLETDSARRYTSADALMDELKEWTEVADASVAPSSMSGVGVPRGVVVLPFKNLSSHQEDDWIGNALAEEIHTTLLTSQNVQVVERHELLALVGRLYAEGASDITGARMLDAAGRVGAGTVIRGSFQNIGGRVMVTASALVSERPEGRMLVRITGAYSDIIELQADLAKQVADTLGYRARRRAASDVPTSRAMRRLYAAAQAAFTTGQYAQAIQHAHAALDQERDAVELLSLLGVCHSRLGQYDQAIRCHKQLEELATRQGDRYRLVEATGNLGVMDYFKGEYPRAYEQLQRAADMAADLDLLPLLAKQCNNMGFVLMRMERLREADQAFEEAIRIKLSLGATASLVSPYNGRGEIALQLGRCGDALCFYDQALVWARELNDHVNIGNCHTHIGKCYAQMGDLEQAERHLTSALETLGATEFWNGMTVAYEQLAELHLTRRQPDAAFDCIEKRIDLAQRHANRHMEAAAWEQKARAYELSAQKDEAMQCLRKSFQLQQSKAPYESASRNSGPRNRRF